MIVEEWESLRRCLRYPVGPWDADASKESHLHAALICRGCPVSDLCYRQTRRDFDDGKYVDGMYAGSIWCTTGKARGVFSVEAWHRTHGHQAGSEAQPQVVAATEERRCAAPGCVAIFEVPADRVRAGLKVRLTCSPSCSDRYRSINAAQRHIRRRETRSRT
jgi:hypothetical protein